MRWLLLKDLQLLRRSPLVTALLVIYPIVIAVLIGFALSRGPSDQKVAFLNQIPEEDQFSLGGDGEDLFETLTLVQALGEAEAGAGDPGQRFAPAQQVLTPGSPHGRDPTGVTGLGLRRTYADRSRGSR